MLQKLEVIFRFNLVYIVVGMSKLAFQRQVGSRMFDLYSLLPCPAMPCPTVSIILSVLVLMPMPHYQQVLCFRSGAFETKQR